jgi:hypothetical protein
MKFWATLDPTMSALLAFLVVGVAAVAAVIAIAVIRRSH